MTIYATVARHFDIVISLVCSATFVRCSYFVLILVQNATAVNDRFNMFKGLSKYKTRNFNLDSILIKSGTAIFSPTRKWFAQNPFPRNYNKYSQIRRVFGLPRSQTTCLYYGLIAMVVVTTFLTWYKRLHVISKPFFFKRIRFYSEIVIVDNLHSPCHTRYKVGLNF